MKWLFDWFERANDTGEAPPMHEMIRGERDWMIIQITKKYGRNSASNALDQESPAWHYGSRYFAFWRL
jgi:hypothetical protein